MKKVLIFLTLFTTFSECAFADLWHVSVTGNDNNGGTTAKTAFKTLQKAESVVQPGDTVFVANGVYTSDLAKDHADGSALLNITKSGKPNASITWKALPGHTPILRTKAWATIQIAASYHIIDGFTITGYNDSIALVRALEASKKSTNDPYYNTNGILIDGRHNAHQNKPHHIIIRNCIVSKMPGGGITAIEADYVTIEDNKVFDNAWFMKYGGSGITFLNNWAFDDSPSNHIIIQRNLVWNNKTTVPWEKTGKLSDGNGILLDVTDQNTASGATNPNADLEIKNEAGTNSNGAAVINTDAIKGDKAQRPIWRGRTLIANNVSAFNGGSGIHTFRTAHVDIVNNTTYWNGSIVDYEELFANRSDDVTIVYNIIVPRPGGRVTSNNKNTNIRWDYNLYPNAQNIMKGEHDIVAEPRFINVSRDLMLADFRLSLGSPGLNSGSEEWTQGIDITHNPHPQTKIRHRGAYEK